MLFVFICTDNLDVAEKRQVTRPAHVARIEELDKQGRVILGGSLLDKENPNKAVGGIMVIDFDSYEAAQAWANEEPFLKAGVYKEIRIQPFNKVFPKNDYE